MDGFSKGNAIMDTISSDGSTTPTYEPGQFPSRPAQTIIGHLSNKWNLLVIRRLSRKTMRYSELRRDIGDISQKMLTQTLRHLERIGLVERKVYPVIPPKVEYSLTELGRSCVVAVDRLCSWAIENIDQVEQAIADYDQKQDEEG